MQTQTADGEIREGYDTHNCCCPHVVEEIEAAPGTKHDHYSAARERYFACPHHVLTSLEVYMGSLL
jgi:hypothetical protein